jgi:hypothetical protein
MNVTVSASAKDDKQLFQNAIQRANSRSAVLMSLQNSFGNKKANSDKISAPSKSPKEDPSNQLPIDNPKNGGVEKNVNLHTHAFADVVSDMIHGAKKKDQFRKLLEESLFTKAIVLENTSAQADAVKSSSREKRY